jgi:long-chain fatty acid transport protein
MLRSLGLLPAALLLATAVPGGAIAQGFSVNEHGSCVMGRAGTGVALPCNDGSSVLFNPSGIAGMTGWTLSGGITLIKAMGSFTDDLLQQQTDLEDKIMPVPHAYLTYGINQQWAAGFGFSVPYGLGTEWPVTFDGRFLGYDNDLRSMYFQPTVAWQPHPRIKLGAGFDFVVGSLKLTQRADLSEFDTGAGLTFGQIGIPYHTDFANARLKASGATGFGGNFGVTWSATDWLSLGARYLTRVKLDYEGTAVFDSVHTNIVLPPGNPLSVLAGTPELPAPIDLILLAADLYSPGQPLSEQTVNTSITMPDQATIGFALKASPKVTLLFDLQWINWSVFDTLVVKFENMTDDMVLVEKYKDTYALRFGLDVAATQNLAVRGGYLYHNGASPPETVTPLLPEGNRNEFTVGLGYSFGSMFSVDLAYQYLKQNDRRGRTRDALPGRAPTVELNNGLYTFNGHLFGGTLVVHF